MNHVAAILLAAGRSRRMGTFKPLLPFGDQTVIESCLGTLQAAGIDDIVVVVAHRAKELRRHLKLHNVRIVINPKPESEMSDSVAGGIKEVADAGAIMIALVDHPAVSRETIEAIVAEWKNGARLIQPEHDGRGGHPVLIDAALREELLHLDSNGGLRSFFESHRDEVRRLTVDCPYVARDMDTWEDYVALHQELFGQPPAANMR